MKTASLLRALQVATVALLSLTVFACNTTKATIDSMVKFTLSTSPDSIFNADGLIREEYKVPLYTAVVYDNLEQDAARGGGEYVTSLGTLVGVPETRQLDFAERAQQNYGVLFAADRYTARKAVEARARAWAAELVP